MEVEKELEELKTIPLGFFFFFVGGFIISPKMH